MKLVGTASVLKAQADVGWMILSAIPKRDAKHYRGVPLTDISQGEKERSDAFVGGDLTAALHANVGLRQWWRNGSLGGKGRTQSSDKQNWGSHGHIFSLPNDVPLSRGTRVHDTTAREGPAHAGPGAVGCSGLCDRVAHGRMIRHTAMPKTKVALTLDSTLLDRVDVLVKRARFRNRSQAIEAAVAEKLARLERTRLAEECAKLDPAEERGLADQPFGADTTWPEY